MLVPILSAVQCYLSLFIYFYDPNCKRSKEDEEHLLILCAMPECTDQPLGKEKTKQNQQKNQLSRVTHNTSTYTFIKKNKCPKR